MLIGFGVMLAGYFYDRGRVFLTYLAAAYIVLAVFYWFCAKRRADKSAAGFDESQKRR